MPSRAINAIIDPNIDSLLNPFIPHNQLRYLPKPVSHFLGYRKDAAKEPVVTIQWLMTILGTVAGICVVGAVFNFAPVLVQWNTPPIIASLGASAVLDYNTIRSPLAQPRNSIIGHAIAAVVGTGISKAFQQAPHFFANYSWVAAAVACGLSSVAMSITNTVHPPGGATAIIACTEGSVIAMGWRFPVIMLIASILMVAVACLVNNVFRQYPVFWWTPEEVGGKIPRTRQGAEGETKDEEDGGELKRVDSSQGSASDRTLQHVFSNDLEYEEHGVEELHVLPYSMRVPREMHLSDEEVQVLKTIQARMRWRSEIN